MGRIAWRGQPQWVELGGADNHNGLSLRVVWSVIDPPRIHRTDTPHPSMVARRADAPHA